MTRRALLLSGIPLIAVLCALDTARAAPMQPTPVELADAAGVRHRVLLHGDEFFSWMSDLDGYPIERGEDGLFRYVEIDGEGRWRRGERLLGSAPSLPRGLRPYPPLDRARIEQWRARRAQFCASPHGGAPGGTRGRRAAPLKPRGKLHALVIPMGFKDRALTKSRADIQAFFDGPVRDYYLEASAGKVELSATVIDPLAMSQSALTFAWNAAHPARPAWQMFEASFSYLEAQAFDFTPFDRNGDGYADLVVVVHAGLGREQTGEDSDLHSHFLPFANISNYPESFTSHDGIEFFGYVAVPEMSKAGDITPLGVLVHEAGHYFGLPDLYDTGPMAGSAAGLGGFCLMAHGMWLGQSAGTSPAHPSAWCKQALGWMTPVELSASGAQRLAPIQSSAGRVLKVMTSDSARDGGQYFLIENRQKSGFDSYLPGEGLLIFHVDEGQFPAAGSRDQFNFNQDPDHYGIDLEQADGRRGLNTTSRRGDAGDPFPTADNIDFTPVTEPDSLAYGAGEGRVFITDIRRAAGGDITFDFSLHAPLPLRERCERDAFCASGICAGTCCEDNCRGICDSVCASARAECPLPEGIACDDGDACTIGDACRAGRCEPGERTRCPAPDECHLATECAPETGLCPRVPAFEGTPCTGGVCRSGACVQGDDGAGDTGCGCQAGSAAAALPLALFGLLGLTRRSRSPL